MKRIVLITTFIVFLLAILVFAHSGRTDAYGGHHNRKTGGYHYHNAGSAHAAGNPYQDHKNCGICSVPKKIRSESKKSGKLKVDEFTDRKKEVMVLQAGLKCMGYKITEIDGIMGQETKKAIKKYLKDRDLN